MRPVRYSTRRFPTPGVKAPSIGKGIGLSICLVVLETISSLGVHHYFYRSVTTGMLLRGGLITAITAARCVSRLVRDRH
jgi:hypothetical protein